MNDSSVTAAPYTESGCCICGDSRTRTLYTLDQFSVVRCIGCGLVSLEISLEPESIAGLYDEGYYKERHDYFSPDASAQAAEQPTDWIQANYSSGLALLKQYAPGQRVLDFGCAVGKFLSMAKADGWNVSGVDISEYAVAHCRDNLGHDAYCGDLRDISFQAGTFDVVTMWDVIEHLPNPVAQLKQINRILSPEGIVLVDTPNQGSLLRSIAHAIYSATGGVAKYPIEKLYHIFHLHYFNRNTLRRAFESSGFEIIYLTSRPIPQVKGRTGSLERLLVNAVALPERFMDRGYELLAVARKSREVIEPDSPSDSAVRSISGAAQPVEQSVPAFQSR